MANLSQRSRLKGLHLRWHVGRGKVVAGCTFCQEPSAKAEPESKPVGNPEFLKPPVPPPAPEEDSLDSMQKQFEKSQIKDKLWDCAVTQLSLPEASKVMKLPVNMIAEIIKAEFSANWDELLQIAKLTVRRDLMTAAIKEARSGDSRLLLRLEELGFFKLWISEERSRSMNVKKMDTDELAAYLAVILRKRGMTEWVGRMSSLLSVVDGSDQDHKDFLTFKHPPVIDVATKPEPSKQPIELARADLQLELPKPTQAVPDADPVPKSKERKPIVATPEPVLPLSL